MVELNQRREAMWKAIGVVGGACVFLSGLLVATVSLVYLNVEGVVRGVITAVMGAMMFRCGMEN